MDLWTQFNKYQSDFVYTDPDKNLRLVDVGLAATFYFKGGHTQLVRLAIAACFEHFQALFPDRLKWVLPNEDVSRGAVKIGGKKQIMSIREYIATMDPDDQLEWHISGGSNTHDASDCYMSVLTTREWEVTGNISVLSWLTFSIPVENVYAPGGQPTLFMDLIRFCCEALKPWQGSAGLASVLPHQRHDAMGCEFDLQQRYYGLDVVAGGYSYFVVNPALTRLKGTNWLVFYDSKFPAAPAYSQVCELTERLPAIRHWYWGFTNVIQAGPTPTLAPVPEGIPPLYKAVNDLIKPYRIDPMPSFHIGSMTGAIHFNGRTSDLWSKRFDAPGIWPPYPDQIEFHDVDTQLDEYASTLPVAPAQPEPEAVVIPVMLQAWPGQPCPESGLWFNNFLHKSVHMQSGQPMPGPKRDAAGNEVIWYLRK